MLFMTSYLVTNSHQTLPKCVKGISVQQLKTAGADKNPPEGIKRKHLVEVVTPPPQQQQQQLALFAWLQILTVLQKHTTPQKEIIM